MPRMIGRSPHGSKKRYLWQMEQDRLAREDPQKSGQALQVNKKLIPYSRTWAPTKRALINLGRGNEDPHWPRLLSELRNHNRQETLKTPAGIRHGSMRTGITGSRVIYGDHWVGKRDPLKTSISEDDAKRLVSQHGLKGPLPKELTREQREAAYEARYVASGGRQGEKWQKRAQRADKVRNAGLAVTTGGLAAWSAARLAGGKGLQLAPRIQHHAETIAGTAGAVGGAGELYAGHARRKRSSYASAPGGVAASALRRMRDYNPE